MLRFLRRLLAGVLLFCANPLAFLRQLGDAESALRRLFKQKK